MGGIFSPFTSPTDSRWQGAKHHRHHKLFVIKNVVLLTFIPVVITDYFLFKSWWENESYGRHKSWQWATYYFWYRIGIALIPDLFVTTISVFLIIDVLPALSFHPIFALIVSVSMFFLYVAICAINISLVAANEIGLINVESWYSITYGEAMFQVILALCYLAMFVYSCIAVHKWRMAKNCANLALSIANRETYDIGGGE